MLLWTLLTPLCCGLIPPWPSTMGPGFPLMGKGVKSSALCISKFRWEKKWRGFYSLDFANENIHSLLGDSFTQFPGLRCQLSDWAQALSKAALSGTICLLYSVSCSKFPLLFQVLKLAVVALEAFFSPPDRLGKEREVEWLLTKKRGWKNKNLNERLCIIWGTLTEGLGSHGAASNIDRWGMQTGPTSYRLGEMKLRFPDWS